MLALRDLAGTGDPLPCHFFPYGSKGMISLGGGLFLFAEARDTGDSHAACIRLYRYTGGEPLFRYVEKEER